MWEKERQQLIIDILEKERFSSVSMFCSRLNISPATIRRDINKMSELGLLKKIRGGAEAINNGLSYKEPSNTQLFLKDRLESEVNNLKLIAKTAAQLCNNNETVIINGGMLTNLMCEYFSGKQLNIMTNSMIVAQSLWGNGDIQVILPGGEVYGPNGLIIGDYQASNDNAPSYYYSKMFISSQAISKLGVMESDKFVARAECKLKSQAEKLIVMAESSSLGLTSNFLCARLDEVDVIITDNGADKDILKEFEEHGIEVIIAK